MPQNFIIKAVALFGGELLRVVQPARQPLGIENDGRCCDRPREGTASGFINSRDRPNAALQQGPLDAKIRLFRPAHGLTCLLAGDPGRGNEARLFLAEAETAEPRIEARQTTAAIEQLLRASGPGRMGRRIDVEV